MRAPGCRRKHPARDGRGWGVRRAMRADWWKGACRHVNGRARRHGCRSRSIGASEHPHPISLAAAAAAAAAFLLVDKLRHYWHYCTPASERRRGRALQQQCSSPAHHHHHLPCPHSLAHLPPACETSSILTSAFFLLLAIPCLPPSPPRFPLPALSLLTAWHHCFSCCDTAPLRPIASLEGAGNTRHRESEP